MRFCLLFIVLLFSVVNISAQAQLIRGPYLQAATDTSLHIRWRTDAATNSRVQWGLSVSNLSMSKEEASSATEHEIVLTGLTPNTKYWYSVGTTSTVLQGDAQNYFMTLPPKGSKGLVRIGVIGDCGNNSINQIAVRDQLQTYLGAAYMNAWILLGDNAYSYGLDAEYQAAFFNIYQDRFLKQNPLFPAPGNHDYSDNATLQNTHLMPYYENFSMPVNGEGGGVPSNNEAYYSFNIGNAHFLSLDSYGQEDNATRLYDTAGKQVQWIKQDLAANQNKDWVIAYWHHPPFSLGSRNSETEADMTAIRTNFIRILERYGVDLILCGHSHNYERSKLQKGFYGYEAMFDAAQHNLSTSSAVYDGSAASCPYVKDTVTNSGTVYVVTGSAGQLGFPSAGYPHDAMYYSNSSIGGAMMLEIEANRLDAKWICADGVVRDKFTMMKKVNTKNSIAINPGDSVVLTASFIGNYVWTPGGATTKTIKVAPNVSTTYYAADGYGCLRDTFNVNINNVPLPATWVSIKGLYNKADQTITVNWKTASERDVLHFVVERSDDGSRFAQAGTVMASGNLLMPANYVFKDVGADKNKAVYYYRIRQVANNGAGSYSPVVAVYLNALNNNFNVQVMPNPAHPGDMKIAVTNTNSSLPATLSIADASGKKIVVKQVVLSASPQSFMPPVRAGIYFVTVEAANSISVVRVVVE